MYVMHDFIKNSNFFLFCLPGGDAQNQTDLIAKQGQGHLLKGSTAINTRSIPGLVMTPKRNVGDLHHLTQRVMGHLFRMLY